MPPQLLFAISAVFHYLGPAFAVLLFARVGVAGVAWLRIAAAGLIFAAWQRPWRAFIQLDQSGQRLLLAWGAVLALMNVCFYHAIDRLPLGTVAAIEFLPVIALAAAGARTTRNALALLLAVPGVYLLTDVRLEGEPLGFAFAFANAALFSFYIVLAHRVSRLKELSGLDGLGAAMLVAVVVVTPLGGWEVVPAASDPVALLAGIGVGVSSSVIPYVTDQLAMRRLTRASYALMVSILPATATVIGVAVLAQVPSWIEVIGVGLVIAGVALHRDGYEERCPTRGDEMPADERDEKAQAKEEIQSLEEDPPSKLEEWPDGAAKYETFGGPENDSTYDDSPVAQLGPSGVRHHEDGSVSVDGEKVDNPEDFKGDPIPGGPTDPDAQRLAGEDA